MQQLIGYLFGFLTVAIRGGSHERFMNLCAVQKRDLWNYTLRGEEYVTVQIRASEYKNLRKAARQSGVKLKIITRHGLPFFLHKFRHRYGLIAGALIFCLLLSGLSQRIWVIEVHGGDLQTTQQIEQLMHQHGIRVGAVKSKFDFSTVRQKMLENCPEVAWMSLNPVGSVLNVDISSATIPPSVLDHGAPQDIYAAMDGQILSMNIKSGTPMVKVGDGVVKGDLLVSGAVEYKDGSTVFRRAQGEVIARTRRQVSVTVPYQQTYSLETGKKTNRYGLSFFGVDFPLYLGSVKGNYRKQISYHPVKIGETQLPIGVYRGEFCFLESRNTILSAQEAISKGKEQIADYVSENLNQVQVEDITYTVEEKEKEIAVIAVILCKENINFEKKLLIFP